MSQKGQATRGRMVAAAARLLQRQGYAGTGLNQITDEAAAPKGSLYFHFPGGKEELAAEAIRASAADWRQAIMGAVGGSRDPARGVRAACEMLAAALEESRFMAGCPVATVALEAAPTSDLIHEACAEGYRTWTELITAALAATGLPAARIARLATTILAAVEGAMVLAKAQRSADPLRQVGAELEALLRDLTHA